MTFYTAADLIAQKEAGYQEARKYCESLERALKEIKEVADTGVAKGPAPFTCARIANIAREALK